MKFIGTFLMLSILIACILPRVILPQDISTHPVDLPDTYTLWAKQSSFYPKRSFLTEKGIMDDYYRIVRKTNYAVLTELNKQLTL